jgi:phosphate transport system substrate-binding protein
MFKKIGLIVMVAFLVCALNAQKVEILGAGATFPQPFYSKLFDEYSQTRDRVNYQGVGSGAGINQLIEKTVDFAGTDAIVTADQQTRAGADIIHIPTCLGAIVVTYNLPDVKTPLKLDSEVISEIFRGKITRWNDKKIANLNKGVKLPNTRIAVVYRSDSSGSTNIFTEYLKKTDKAWADEVGAGTTVNWKVEGIGARGNPGVAGEMNQKVGAIGYVELVYALSNNMAYADIQNKAKNFIKPTIESVQIAADVAIPPDTKVSLTDTDAPQGYPISSFTWVILYKEQNYNNRSAEQAKATLNLIQWMITDGQAYASELHYAPLSDAAKNAGLNLLKSVTFDGKNVLQ